MVRTLLPHFEGQPTAFGKWMRAFDGNWRSYCKAAGVSVNRDLEVPVTAALRRDA